MPVLGHRHKLLVYSSTLDQYWRLLFFIGLFLVIIAFSLIYIPIFQTVRQARAFTSNTLWMVAGAGTFSLLAALFLATIRYFAYVQPHEDHLRLVTPFLQIKISYRRIRQATSAQFDRLFPPPYKRSRKTLCNRLAHTMVIVIDMNGFPLSRSSLLFFLSPMFFPDQTPRLALLVPDWIKFSNELESFRGAWMQAQQLLEPDPRQSLYSSLSLWDNGR